MTFLPNWVSSDWNERCLRERKHTPTLLFSIAELWYNGVDFNIGQLFKIHYDDLIKIYYILTRDLHISWSDFNDMPWWWLLMTVDQHSESVKEQNEQSEKQSSMFAEQQASMEAMYKQQQQNMPKFDTPSMPNFGQLGTNLDW